MTTHTSSFILKTMNVLFWVIFIGLCIQTGAILVSFLISMFVNAEGAKNLYMGINLSELYQFSTFHYVGTVSLFIALSGLKTYIAFLVVKIFWKFDFSNPFKPNTTELISKISYVALEAGILAIIATSYCKWIAKKDIAVPIHWGGEEILFFAGVIYIIAQIFKRGSDIQTENELTV